VNCLVIAPANDRASIQIIDWLYFIGATRVFKCSFPELISKDNAIISIESLENTLQVELSINNHKIDSVWFWRDEDYDSYVYDQPGNERLIKRLREHLSGECKRLRKFFLDNQFPKAFKLLSSSSYENLNKLETLMLAKRFHLSVPDFLVTNTKSELLEFKEKHKSVITKAIDEGLTLNSSDLLLTQYTEEITDDIFEKIPETFFPTLFQEKIVKDYEIRTFFLGSEFYSMAIFSQSDDQTKVDFRRYNPEKWNRNVPYKLPFEVSAKLQKLMAELNLDTGSVDLVRDASGRLIFLEVNPNGQFGMVSKPCNYGLERKIAEYLILS
jgi:ATP-GRASP peptide maturase of grasp-with-spasm system